MLPCTPAFVIMVDDQVTLQVGVDLGWSRFLVIRRPPGHPIITPLEVAFCSQCKKLITDSSNLGSF